MSFLKLGRRRVTGPIFIVGSGRSGTSVLLNTLHKTLNLPCHGEGHFYPLALPLITATNDFFEKHASKSESSSHMLHDVKVEEVRGKIGDMIAEIYKKQYGANVFIDKTPGPTGIEAIPFIQEAFPDIRIIYTKRRGIEVVRSAVRKFPHVAFEGHCEIWRDSMTTWRDARPKLHVPYLEIDQHDIALNPALIAEQIGELLELNPHQVNTVKSYLLTDRPQSSGKLNSGTVNIESSGWDEKEIKIFRKICGPIMTVFGYTEDGNYRIDTE
ncbi:sulfotransferase family protein [Robiginitomaculum antarcticum]|uniref:sulfotransferase family protein n=1 Tax=Robiginitomaculum antarcticum TaxID=437507 RepID=UPI0012EAFB0C|nr:sulfotransferase [Robiginitomaculum antarcticum]